MDSFTLIPSSYPVFRVEARASDSNPSGRYVMKLAAGINEDVDRPGGAAPRFHPPGTDALLQMSWLEALSRDTNLPLQTPVRNAAGELITAVAIEGREDGTEATLCRWLPGRILSGRGGQWAGVATIRQIGRTAARLHAHAEHWELPRGYILPTVGWQDVLSEAVIAIAQSPHVRGVPARDMRIVEQAVGGVHEVMHALGVQREHFGIIHEDLHPGNLLAHDGTMSPIDFSNAVFGYYLWDVGHTFDLGRALDRAFWPRHRAYTQGYQEVRELPADYRRIMNAMCVTFWIAETAFALDSQYADTAVPKIKLPRAVWTAERFVSGEKFLDF